MEGYNILEVLEHIDPSLLDYQDWVNVGMALKEEGCTASDWDAWSRRDAARYHAGECYRKWGGFHGSLSPVTGGTIVQLAKDQGWQPESGGRELDWDDTISNISIHEVAKTSTANPSKNPIPSPAKSISIIQPPHDYFHQIIISTLYFIHFSPKTGANPPANPWELTVRTN